MTLFMLYFRLLSFVTLVALGMLLTSVNAEESTRNRIQVSLSFVLINVIIIITIRVEALKTFEGEQFALKIRSRSQEFLNHSHFDGNIIC